ncbi:hypothetical protein NQD34_018355 [Periophthalmus magnuspinnatus]|nr:hypothetical protein NQD34_018355 [Periophthalmus magnuspinnatus]
MDTETDLLTVSPCLRVRADHGVENAHLMFSVQGTGRSSYTAGKCSQPKVKHADGLLPSGQFHFIVQMEGVNDMIPHFLRFDQSPASPSTQLHVLTSTLAEAH